MTLKYAKGISYVSRVSWVTEIFQLLGLNLVFYILCNGLSDGGHLR